MAVEPMELLRDLVRIRSINPPGDESTVAPLLGEYLSEAGLETKLLTSPAGRSNLVARLDGPHDRPALVLLSHSDVVPVEEDSWSREPFVGEVEGGFLWGRGTLDMKGIAVMHAVAAARLAASGQQPTREVVVVMVSDEEAGGDEGARWLLEEHPELVGFGDDRPPPEVIGEGGYGITGMLPHPVVPIVMGEKTAVWFEVIASGESGHGGLPPKTQAPVNLAALVTEVAGFGTPRVHPVMREQFATLAGAAPAAMAAVLRVLSSPAGSAVSRPLAPQMRKVGAVGLLLSDSITPTAINAGYKSNVVPGEARASFDARLLPDTDVDDFIASIGRRAARHGARVGTVVQKGRGPVSGKSDLFEILFDASKKVAPDAVPTASLTPGITDLRFFRARGATGYGWTPLVLTPELLATIHGHDERIPVDGFERAVDVMADVVQQAAG